MTQRLWTVYTALLVAISVAHVARKLACGTGGWISRWSPLLVAAVVAIGVEHARRAGTARRRLLWRSVAALLTAGVVATLALVVGYVLGGTPIHRFAWPLAGVALLSPAVWRLWHTAGPERTEST